MTKADERRAAILDRLADHVLAEGLSAASLRPLARAAGISDRMLLYYFKDKSEVIAATLAQVAGRLRAVLDARTGAGQRPLGAVLPDLMELLQDEALWPYLRLWLELAAQAGRGDPVLRPIAEAIARGFLVWAGEQLDTPDPAARAGDAARLLVTIEGMILLRSVGLDDVCEAALRPPGGD